MVHDRQLRIVSQDGTIDLPYDRIVLKAYGPELIAFYGNERFTLAKYRHDAEVTEQMERIWEAYNERNIVVVLDRETE